MTLRLIGTFALAALWLACLVIGTGRLDLAVLAALRSVDNPQLRDGAMLVTALGGWRVLAATTAISALLLVLRRRLAAAASLVAITVLGRVSVDLQKLTFARIRPEESLRLINVDSHAFPSGHAANSMITYLAIAMMLLRAERDRRLAVLAAVVLSIAVGLTRIALGVHWPTDVVAGWSFGILWIWLCCEVSARAKFARNKS